MKDLERRKSKSSPYRRKNSPYWWVRRVVSGIGEIRLSTRTTSIALARRYDTMVCDLRDLGEFDALQALKSGQVRFHELYTNQTPSGLNSLLKRAETPLLHPLVGEWLSVGADDRGVRDGSMRRYGSSWRQLLKLIPNNATLDEIDQDFVSAFKRHRRKEAKSLGRSLSPATLNRDLAALGAFLTWCAEERSIAITRPVIRYQQETKGRTRWLTREEVTAFRQACPTDWWPLFALLFSTGITIGEALGLRLTDIDLKAGRLSIHEEYGRKLKRSSRNRELQIDAPVLNVLHQWIDALSNREPTARVFPFTYSPARKAWGKACVRADIHGATIHDTRHSFAVHAVQNGVPEARLQKLLGHAHAGTTRRYAMHAPEAYLAKDAALVSNSMGLQIPPLVLEKLA